MDAQYYWGGRWHHHGLGFISDERWHHGYGSYDGEANRYGGYGYGWRGHHGCCW